MILAINSTLQEHFPVPWEDWWEPHRWPNPRGLLYGLFFVLVAQAGLLMWYRFLLWLQPRWVQKAPPPKTTWQSDLWQHISAPESFFLVYGYLSSVWMFGLMPASYYDLTKPLSLFNVLIQFLVVDFWIYVSHRLEHVFPTYYKKSHKLHHRFTSPKLYNAFNGSVPDTMSLILAPLLVTHWCVPFAHTWDFIVFGTAYATQLSLIHCEFPMPWDHIFQKLGIATTADHHVHHSTFVWNYGHFFVYWDKIMGTYKAPQEVEALQWGR